MIHVQERQQPVFFDFQENNQKTLTPSKKAQHPMTTGAPEKRAISWNDECPICLEEYNIKKVAETDCNHFFHSSCINEHLKHNENPACPLCRAPLNERKFSYLNPPRAGSSCTTPETPVTQQEKAEPAQFPPQKCIKSLYSKWSCIDFKGLFEKKEMFKSAFASDSISLDNASILGKTESKWGKVKAKDCKLDAVTAYCGIELTNTSATDVMSKFGRVTVKQNSDSSTTISSIKAPHNITMEKATVSGKIRSLWGKVFANESHLGSVSAFGNVELVNTSAQKVKSITSDVIVRQCDGSKRAITYIGAYKEVFIENSTLKNVVCSQKAVIHNSTLETLTMHVSPFEEAFIDLSDSKITQGIDIKIYTPLVNTAAAFLRNFLTSFFNEAQTEFTDYKGFSLFIKCNELPNNISFKGIDTNLLITERTDNGFLISVK